MPKPRLSEQFDQIVTALLASRATAAPNSGQQLADAAAIAAELRTLPRQDFKATLKSQLEGRTPMASKPAATPEARQTATAFLTVNDAARAIEFYKQAFGATEIMRMNGPGKNIGFAEIRIGNTSIMLSDEFPQYGNVSAQTLGGSPARIHLAVDDADAVAARAVAAGAREIHPVQDQFYGERSGQFADPFGYVWMIATRTENLTAADVQRRFDDLSKGAPAANEQQWVLPVPYIRKGFRTLTPYLLVPDAARVIEFFKDAFGAAEIFRVPRAGSNLIMHAEVRVLDSIIELADASEEFKARASANILYVPDVDAVYARAIKAGGRSLSAPVDQVYGDRECSVQDPGGNSWYVTTPGGSDHITADTPSIVPCFHVRDAAKYIEFLKQAFGAQEAATYKAPDGTIEHVRLRLGSSILAGGEAHGEFQGSPFLLHIYVPDTDAVYANALRAGATTIRGLENAPYGDRTATVQDPVGNLWSIATHVKDVKF